MLKDDLPNKAAVEYNKYAADKLNEIFAPLFANSQINTFGYRKFFPDGSYIALCTRNDWQEYYFNNIPDLGLAFSQAVFDTPLYQITFFLWPKERGDSILDALWHFDIWNGITAYYKTGEYIESFAFAGYRNDTQLHNYFINNLALLEKYIDHFKEKAAELIKPDDNKMAKFQNTINICLKPILCSAVEKSEFCFLDNNTHRMLDSCGSPVKLSRREAECLVLLSKGHTAKSIAIHLNISFRTVEAYIHNIKSKTKTNCKAELLSLILRS